MRIKPVGDKALLLEIGEEISEKINGEVMAWKYKIEAGGIPGLKEMVPAFSSLLIYYDPYVTDYKTIKTTIDQMKLDENEEQKKTGKLVEIPVCYGGMHGEDLAFVANHAGLSEKEVIDIHCGRDYLIYMIGFLPGFPYLGGMDSRIFTPRLTNPRTKIPAGSVGIGGEQTGIYPIESPGGWQLIGTTPLQLFSATGEIPPYYEAGDRIRFYPISKEEFEQWH